MPLILEASIFITMMAKLSSLTRQFDATVKLVDYSGNVSSASLVSVSLKGPILFRVLDQGNHYSKCIIWATGKLLL
jgi:hypothetical protein